MRYIYRIFAADGRLLYVGQTCDPKRRLTQHGWRRDYPGNTVTVEGPHHRPLAEVLERRAIMTERPVRNSTWRGCAWVDGEPLLHMCPAANYIAGSDAVRWTHSRARHILDSNGLTAHHTDSYYRLADLEAKYLELRYAEINERRAAFGLGAIEAHQRRAGELHAERQAS